MALTIEATSDHVVSLEEYVHYVNKHVDLDDFDSFLSSAPIFDGLLQNRSLLTKRLNRELLNARDYQKTNGYSGPVTLLEVNERYIVRANIWEPVRTYDQEWLTDDSAYSYLNVHDHNFTFMTGGYYGDGYSTTIWEWDGLKMIPEPGDHVDLRFLEHTQLPQGKIMVYRASRDVHRQEHAHEFSVSLNLLIRPPIASRPQYRFDPERSCVQSYTSAEVATRHTLCQIAPLLGNADTVQLLTDIAWSHGDPNFRASALLALRKACVLDEDELERIASCDPDGRVIAFVKSQVHASHA